MKRTKQERVRLGIVYVLIALTFAVVLGRLVHLQVFLADKYQAIVKRQSTGRVDIPADRGVIYDRNGKIVAHNVYRSSLYAYPKDEQQVAQVARYVEKTFGMAAGTARKICGLQPGRFRWIKRQMKDQLAAKIEKDAPYGLYLRKEAKRQYPFELVGKQILGFTDIDNKGCSGLEYSLDSVLAGAKGSADIRRDGKQKTYRVQESALVKPIPGLGTVLTIDWPMQEIVEEELRRAVFECKAESGMAAFVDCNSGDILAMAHFDPSEKNRKRPVKLRAATDRWEPGSIFKAFTAAALLDHGLIDFGDTTFCEDGAWRINGRLLRDDKKHGWMSFREIMELSSNIGIAKYAIEMGGEELYNVADAFGLGKKLLGTLPGETSGKISPPSRWSDYNTAAYSIGHSIAVSTLQMAVAFGAIANGGELLKPRLVLGHVDEDGYVINRDKADLLGRVMKRSSADSLRAFLRGVVERGTAEAVNSLAISIAGKTGTAQIFDVKNMRYYRSKYMASFAGFFPAERPLVAGIVVLKEPQPVHYGGLTAGPAFRRIAEQYSILRRDLFSSEDFVLFEEPDDAVTVEVPDFVGLDVSTARDEASELGLKLRSNDGEGRIVWQFPLPDRLLFGGGEVITVEATQSIDDLNMMDLNGLSLRQATAFCRFANLSFEVQGSGWVVKQSIRPGSKIKPGTVCRLKCRTI